MNENDRDRGKREGKKQKTWKNGCQKWNNDDSNNERTIRKKYIYRWKTWVHFLAEIHTSPG